MASSANKTTKTAEPFETKWKKNFKIFKRSWKASLLNLYVCSRKFRCFPFFKNLFSENETVKLYKLQASWNSSNFFIVIFVKNFKRLYSNSQNFTNSSFKQLHTFFLKPKPDKKFLMLFLLCNQRLLIHKTSSWKAHLFICNKTHYNAQGPLRKCP